MRLNCNFNDIFNINIAVKLRICEHSSILSNGRIHHMHCSTESVVSTAKLSSTLL